MVAYSRLLQAKYMELDARFQALKLRHRSVLDNYLVAKEVIATGSLVDSQLQDRLREEEEARKRAENELACCKEKLQAFKDKSLSWCESYMETVGKLHVAEEQYRLDRKEWEDDLKEMKEQRDQYMAVLDSHRMDERDQDQQWQDAKAKVILARSKNAINASVEKRKPYVEGRGEEALKRAKISAKGKENGESPCLLEAFCCSDFHSSLIA
ncbi:hypothetical protein QFC20_003845 [Naganishia adeliensis]|uniref:Uncharacterized protein n=1 Tax=Naganishia adeliensis TaxID=92952 RepID=A0ACC2W738_9TREE|nr:hypothetical protein QFC20_003845 [Naganishia adeliensis]